MSDHAGVSDPEDPGLFIHPDSDPLTAKHRPKLFWGKFFLYFLKFIMAIFYSYEWSSTKNLVSTLKGIEITKRYVKFFDIRSDSSRIRIRNFENRIRDPAQNCLDPLRLLSHEGSWGEERDLGTRCNSSNVEPLDLWCTRLLQTFQSYQIPNLLSDT